MRGARGQLISNDVFVVRVDVYGVVIGKCPYPGCVLVRNRDSLLGG